MTPSDDPTLLAARLCQTRPLASHADGRRYELTPVVVIEPGAREVEAITRICNEPHIWSTLFAEILAARPYAPDDAIRFLDWGSAGWESGTHFVWLILDERGEVAGAIDIKSPSIDSAEIGYWLGAGHRGIMTNAVRALAELAREAGFRGLHALVKPDNERSARVLERAGFSLVGAVERNDRLYDRWELKL